MCKAFINDIEASPIIAAVKDDDGLHKCLSSEVNTVFILYGDVCTIPSIVKTIKDSGRTAMVHMDLISGLSARDISVDFIKQYTPADGIISTKYNLIAHAKEIGLNTVLRFFVLDSMALVNIEKQSKPGITQPDAIEILPGIVVPKVIKKINSISRVPVIAGGLISDKDDVMNALSNGAIGISSTNQDVWFL
ncbi:MAG: glycerol-3-phosphate responsive antiterminator [Butyrivibrio sp.]|nr:glycerol-3-phosphate responsive antiterminator [Butyrivibrio sp.]